VNEPSLSGLVTSKLSIKKNRAEAEKCWIPEASSSDSARLKLVKAGVRLEQAQKV
jgi:hypothetical protein